MDTGQLLTILDLSGVWAFAVSGSLTAMQKRMDIFGVLLVAFGTSFAGGTIRDVLINRPVFWLHNEAYRGGRVMAGPGAGRGRARGAGRGVSVQ